MRVIGIDPGKDGGVAVLDPDFPSVFVTYRWKGTPEERWRIIRRAATPVMASYVERCPIFVENNHARPGQGVSSMFTFGKECGMALAFAIAIGGAVREVRPADWHRTLFGSALRGGGSPKQRALEYVKLRFPDAIERLTPPRCRTPHDGMVDALCIALYGADQLRMCR